MNSGITRRLPLNAKGEEKRHGSCEVGQIYIRSDARKQHNRKSQARHLPGRPLSTLQYRDSARIAHCTGTGDN